MKTLIVEDEASARHTLGAMLHEFCPEVELVGMAENGVDAVKMIRELKPELVFMDIDIPRLSGLDVLDLIKDEMPAVIFVTAHPDHVMKAIKFRPHDYLLKPLHPDELQAATEKVSQYLASTGRLHADTQMAAAVKHRIRLPTSDGYIFMDQEQIVALMATGSYTTIFTAEAKPLVVAVHLKVIAAWLNEQLFFRCHHSYVINLNRIKKWVESGGPHLLMDNGMKVEVARRRKAELQARLGDQRA